MPRKSGFPIKRSSSVPCYSPVLPSGMRLPPRGLIFSDFNSPLNVKPQPPAKAYPLYSNFGLYVQ